MHNFPELGHGLNAKNRERRGWFARVKPKRPDLAWLVPSLGCSRRWVGSHGWLCNGEQQRNNDGAVRESHDSFSGRPNVRDQRRRALGAPLADPSPSSRLPVPASGVPTRADRCIA
jgi:hypothetical protein